MFSVVKVLERKERKFFIAIGHNRVSDYMHESEAYARIKHKDWDLIMRVMAFIGERAAKGAADMEKIKDAQKTI
ncbi:MAG: hypothetical protein [Malazfec virus 2]